MRIDIIRTSASAPRWIKESTEALKQFLKWSGELRWIVHEDVLNKEASDQCLEYIRENYDLYEAHNPPIGQGHSLTWLLGQSDSKYILNIEDDFKPVREIDLDLCVNLMETCPDRINQICFNKRETMSEKPGFKKAEVKFGDTTLTTNPHWALIPALWRAEYIKPRWVDFKQGDHWDLNDRLKGRAGKVLPAEWVLNNTKTFYFGPIGERQLMQHLGCEKSRREHQI